MGNLRERTEYLKMGDGEIGESGSWMDIYETTDGGAEVLPMIDALDFVDFIFAKSLVDEKGTGEFSLSLSDDFEKVYFFEKDGTPMKFDKVMRIIFG